VDGGVVRAGWPAGTKATLGCTKVVELAPQMTVLVKDPPEEKLTCGTTTWAVVTPTEPGTDCVHSTVVTGPRAPSPEPDLGGGGGAKEIDGGTSAQMPGFCGTNGAQMATMYVKATWA
jgi:hypothetical protein